MLPLLRHETLLEATVWLRESLTTFGTSVASFLPGHFAAYARIHHPFEYGGMVPVAPGTWSELAARYGRDISSPGDAEAFAYGGVPDSQARVGEMTLPLIDALLDHLRPATSTPESCWFAVWEGFGGLAVPLDLGPRLELPNRRYHVFAGPIDGARTSFDAWEFGHRSANLWWPADHAWCVATEIDHAWSYVGGSRECIDALLADPRLDAVATRAADLW